MTMAMVRQRMAAGRWSRGFAGGGSRHTGTPNAHWLRYRGLEAETAKLPCSLPQLDAGQLSWLDEVIGVNLQAPGVSVGVRRGGGFTDGDP
jgi:hypothetical protein